MSSSKFVQGEVEPSSEIMCVNLHAWQYERVCMWVCMHMCESKSERERECVCVYEREYVFDCTVKKLERKHENNLR